MVLLASVAFFYGSQLGNRANAGLNRLWASILHQCLGHGGVQVVQDSSSVISPGVSMDVESNGNCLFLWIAVLVLVGFAPWSIKHRATLLIPALLATAFFNLLRLLSTFLVGMHSPKLGLTLHLYVWPFAVASLLGLLYWRVLHSRPRECLS